MTFIFEDGTRLGIESAEAHSFIRHDLDWTVQAHGKLIDVSYGRPMMDKINLISGKAMTALERPMRKCSHLLTRLLSFIGGREAPSGPAKGSGGTPSAFHRQPKVPIRSIRSGLAQV
jgi:hypothetical protein